VLSIRNIFNKKKIPGMTATQNPLFNNDNALFGSPGTAPINRNTGKNGVKDRCINDLNH
jgi:hypothetical protein